VEVGSSTYPGALARKGAIYVPHVVFAGKVKVTYSEDAHLTSKS